MTDGLRCCASCEYSRLVTLLGGSTMLVCDGGDELREVEDVYRCEDFEPWEGGVDE